MASASARESAIVRLPARRAPLEAAFVALRPRQWPKNLLLYAGIVFAAELGDPVRWLKASLAFVAYCAASSAAYLVNDVQDARDDRLHPLKRSRPIARGELPVRTAVALAGGLGLLAFALTVPSARAQSPSSPGSSGCSSPTASASSTSCSST